ncbi:Structural maintenance of chromosomes protein 6 [Chamberlinius hualienensis]
MSSKRKHDDSDSYPFKHLPTSNTDSENEDDDDDDDDDIVNEISTVSTENKFLKHGTQCGIIESINLKQFMCHNHFSIKFCPNMNYVVGKNGSGKSAIMTAVVVGLGGTAGNTSRGSTVKGFIQLGKQMAEINIRLRNIGRDAYKPDVYGDSIEVQRIIRARGNSSYNIKNSSGKIISNHKSELNFILDHFNIQVDNPISILNQDLSRQFLRTEDPKSKYKFFMRATQLEQISRDYVWIDKNRNLAKEYLENKKISIPELEKEVEKWKIKHDLIMSLNDLKRKREFLNGEFMWANIAALEKELQGHLNKLDTLEERHRHLTTKTNKEKEINMKLESDCQEVHLQIETIKKDLDTLQPQRLQIKNEYQNLRKDIQQQNTTLETVSKRIQNNTSDRDRLISRIAELQSATTNKTAAEKANRLQKLTESQNQMDDLKRHLQTAQNHADNLKQSRDQLNVQINQLRNEDRAFSSQLQAAKKKLKAAENARGDRQKRFGHWVPEALIEIEKAYQKGVFRRKPVGPLGLDIKVRDPKWTLAVEAILKPYLFAFICDNTEDERKLEKTIAGILKKYQSSMPMVISSRFQNEVYDVSRHCVRCEEFPSVLDMLDIDNPVIINCLIDQRGIECILLIDNDEDARKVMLHKPPRNCRESFTLGADQLYPSPNFRFYSSRKTRVDFFMDIEDNITALNCDIADINEKIRTNNNVILLTEDKLKTIVSEFKESERNVMRIRSQVSKITVQMNELRSIEEEEPVYVSALEGDLAIFNEQLESLKNELSETKKNRQLHEVMLKEAKEKLSNIESDLNAKANENLLPLKEKLVLLTADIGRHNANIKHYESQMMDLAKKMNTEELTSRDKKNDLERFTNLALKEMPRPEVIRDESEIQSERLQLQKCLQEEEKLLESKEVIMRQYIQVLTKFNSVKQDIEVLEEFLKKIDKLMVIRRRNYKQFQKALGLRVSVHFAHLYQTRNEESGIINFDHTKGTLSISVQPNGNSSKAQNMASLSGGERSFSTVCFILALWEAIDSPFRMLDEFDVYMDLVNRRHSMGILDEFANSHQFCQFVFFTPLELHDLQVSNNRRIFKMNDPERNQGTLPFIPVNENT